MTSSVSLKLIKPALEFADAFIAWSIEEVEADPRLNGILPCNLQQLEDYIRCREVQELTGDADTLGIRQTTYWLIRDDADIVGESRLRHSLSTELNNVAGHVDYGIRTSERRKGYGTRQLALLKNEARILGIDRLLVVCRQDNEGSIRVIEKNGGMHEDMVIHPVTGKNMLRYWITL